MPEFTDFDAVISDGVNTQNLIAYEDDSTKPSTQTLPLRPPKQAITSPTEFEQSPAYGDLFGQGDFSHGMGQRRYHSPGRDPKRYWYSDGVDISDPGQVRLLHDALSRAVSSADIGRVVEICNDLPFCIVNNSNVRIRRGDGTFPGTWTSEDPGGGSTFIDDLTSQGDILYAAQNNVYQRSAAGVWSSYVTAGATPIDRILWTKGRLIVADGRNIYEITGSGALPTAMESLPSGWRYECIWEQGEYIYAAAISTLLGRTEIHHYGPNQTLSALEKKGQTEMPRGQIIHAGAGYMGTGYIGGGVIEQGNAAKQHPIIYQTIQDARGFLELVKLAEDNYVPTAGDYSVRAFEPYGEAMLMGWNAHDSITYFGWRSGLAIHYPSRDAFANHLSGSNTGGGAFITGIRIYRGRILFVRAGYGLHYESTTDYVSDGSITTSFADFNNAGQKIWDTFDISHSALRASEHIDILSTFDPDALGTYTVLSSSELNSRGKTATDVTNVLKGRVIQMTAYLSRGSDITKTPSVYSLSARSNPFPTTPEFVLTRTYRLFERDRKDDLAQEVFANPDGDRAVLEGFANKWVTVQEPNKTWNAYVVGVTDITPLVPDVRVSGGADPSRKGYIVQMQMIAR